MFFEDPNETAAPEDHTPLTADDLAFPGEAVLDRQREFLSNSSGDFDLAAFFLIAENEDLREQVLPDALATEDAPTNNEQPTSTAAAAPDAPTELVAQHPLPALKATADNAASEHDSASDVAPNHPPHGHSRSSSTESDIAHRAEGAITPRGASEELERDQENAVNSTEKSAGTRAAEAKGINSGEVARGANASSTGLQQTLEMRALTPPSGPSSSGGLTPPRDVQYGSAPINASQVVHIGAQNNEVLRRPQYFTIDQFDQGPAYNPYLAPSAPQHRFAAPPAFLRPPYPFANPSYGFAPPQYLGLALSGLPAPPYYSQGMLGAGYAYPCAPPAPMPQQGYYGPSNVGAQPTSQAGYAPVADEAPVPVDYALPAPSGSGASAVDDGGRLVAAPIKKKGGKRKRQSSPTDKPVDEPPAKRPRPPEPTFHGDWRLHQRRKNAQDGENPPMTDVVPKKRWTKAQREEAEKQSAASNTTQTPGAGPSSRVGPMDGPALGLAVQGESSDIQQTPDDLWIPPMPGSSAYQPGCTYPRLPPVPKPGKQ
ncbi:uncharacterized protein SCHCODRAFT_02212343 [Schizophyllum commune H4-8]|nr:uncharacterized protein SCHCODRAFT_02212343 [Schizophyllum commune H4-8]KAI5894591.1 hypothetical protein SCHCODRAFT_02212343 [Schizophyllum commune H4-8]